jgi:hypothetical protein
MMPKETIGPIGLKTAQPAKKIVKTTGSINLWI